MRKRIFPFLFTMLLAAVLSFSTVSCSSCRNGEVKPTEPVELVYDFNQTIIEDCDWIASQYETFRFLEADAEFDCFVSDSTPNVISVRTVFQVGDTCIMINHLENDTVPVITKENDYWMECMAINARMPISLDSALKIAEPYKEMLNTRRLTLRKLVGPPFPEHSEYIFGNGKLFIDSHTGAARTE